MKKIAVAGAGYVGMANACLLAKEREVVIVEINKDRVDMINNGVSPIVDKEITESLSSGQLKLHATTDAKEGFADADYVIIATPTNYDENKNYFDTGSVESVIRQVIEYSGTAVCVIKSTIPLGFTKKIVKTTGYENIIFAPEFLREGRALYDNQYPARIIAGYDKSNEELDRKAHEFVSMMMEGVKKADVPVLMTGSTEAESVKLFSNTYLALRVAFFNELDMYAESQKLDASEIIRGVCLDPRIGDYYNNPSFGYGGYCLPKDTKQLLANYKDLPNDIIGAIIASNDTRKQYIADRIMERNPKVVGVYRLAMKYSSDNYRQSSIIDVMNNISERGVKVVIYDPSITKEELFGHKVTKDMEKFKRECDVIITNRYDVIFDDVKEKIYTRDIYSRD